MWKYFIVLLASTQAFAASYSRFNDVIVKNTVTIGATVGPSTTAILDVRSTTKGMLPPRMTTTQRNAISTPAKGLFIFNTTSLVPNFYDGSAWQALLTSLGSNTAPTTQKFTSGSGTYTLPTGPSPLSIEIIMPGGGGGGSGSSTAAAANGGAGGNGGDSTFGTSLLVAHGGSGGTQPFGCGTSATASLGSGPTGLALPGGTGQGAIVFTGGAVSQGDAAGGMGGGNALGGAGAGGTNTVVGADGAAGTGGGGGGGGGPNGGVTNGSDGGGGGCSGAYVYAIITSPASTYAYAVGAGGTAGSAGTGTGASAGGAGGSANILVIERYQ